MIGAAPATPFHIRRAVSPWSCATALAMRAKRSPATVIENGSPPIAMAWMTCPPGTAWLTWIVLPACRNSAK
jgi:hypothetical protein